MQRTIVGVFASGDPPRPEDVRRRLDRVFAGGAHEVVVEGRLALGFTGPAAHTEGPVLCLLDGELYDREELAGRIGASEHASDEALLARAYLAEGEAMVPRLRGAFLFVLWNRERQRGLVVRDQFGGQAVFLANPSGRELVLGSEVRDVIGLLGRRPPPDHVALIHWLAYGSCPLGHTLYEGVRPLRPAHALRLSAPGVEPWRYWEPRYQTPTVRRRGEAVEHAGAHLRRAITRRVPAAGPIGVLLGGGIDSTTVAALTRELAPHRELRAYSAVFPHHASVDESALIDRTVDALGMSSTRVVVGAGSMLAGAIAFQAAWDLPLLSVNHGFLRPLVVRAGSDGTGVLIDGEGGDELFGLSPYLLADLVRAGRLARAVAFARRFPGAGRHPPLRPALRLVHHWGARGALPWWLHRGVRRARDPRRYAPLWLARHATRTLAATYDDLAWKRLHGPRWWAMLASIVTDVREQIGGQDYMRRRASGTGVGVHHPMLDDVDLTEAMLAVQPELAFDPDFNRPLARALTADLLPDEVRLHKEKLFWNEVFDSCLMGPDRAAIVGLLSDPTAEIRAYVDVEPLRRTLEGDPRAYQGRATWSHDAWRCATAELWLRAQADPGFTERAAHVLGVCEWTNPITTTARGHASSFLPS